METAETDGGKPHLNIGIIGHHGHGKTTLTAAITKYFGEPRSYDQISAAPQRSVHGALVSASRVACESDGRCYTHVDCPDHANFVKMMISGAATLDGAVLVVSAKAGTMPETRQQVRLAEILEVPFVVVYLNLDKGDDDDDDPDQEEILDLVEMEIRDLLTQDSFPGDSVPVIRGSALHALNGSEPDIGEQSVRALIAAMDVSIPTPAPRPAPPPQPFQMPIDSLLSLSGDKTIAIGCIAHGVVRVGDEVEIVGLRPTRKLVCTGIDQIGKVLDVARAGDKVGLSLPGLRPADLERGQVICAPGSVQTHTVFRALVYLFPTHEGGRDKIIPVNQQQQFHFRGADVAGAMAVPGGIDRLGPGGDYVPLITLTAPVGLEVDQRFEIREGGRRVGVGTVLYIEQ